MARRSTQWMLVLLTSAVLATSGGCAATSLALWVLKGDDVPAEFDKLRDKKVAVVCRPTTSLQYSSAGVDKQLARAVGLALQLKVRKLKLVDPDKVEKWIDENSWDEFKQVGAAVDCDLLVAIDLEAFSLYQSQTIYQGKASVTVKVLDMAEDGQVVFEKSPQQLIYPEVGGVPTDRPESQFRREFVARLSDSIGRYFYPHSTSEDFARDTAAYKF